MTTFEAMQLAAALKGAIPTMTDTQIGHAVEDLENAEHAVGVAAVEHYTREHDEFRRNSLLAILKTEALRLGVTTEAAEKQKRRAEEERTAAYWQRVEKCITDFTDEELAALKADVLPKLPPNVRALVEGRDVRRSSILKSAIYDMLVLV